MIKAKINKVRVKGGIVQLLTELSGAALCIFECLEKEGFSAEDASELIRDSVEIGLWKADSEEVDPDA